MFDPKAAGEEADKMINELNQPSAEDQGVDATEAIVQDGPTSNDDQGVGTTDATPQQDDTSQKLEALTKQIQQAEQRWKVLQGMVDKKDSEIETLRSLLAQVSTGTQASAETPAAPPANLLTADDANSFGEDLIDMTKRASMSVLQAEMPRYMKSIEDRLSKLEGSVQGVQQVAAKTSQDQFFDGLVSAVADWEEINVDTGFLEWLNETDQFTGATRMELLQHAFGKQDVARTAAFFLEFKRLYRSEPETTQSSKIAKLVAPGKAKNSAARVEPAGKRMWSRAEIAKLYSDKRENRITQKAFDEFERDIFAAQNDGRIAA